MLSEANEYFLAHNDDDRSKPPHPENGTDESSIPKEESVNKRTLDIDATCAPVNIRYPQNISLLNEAREKLEYMICSFTGVTTGEREKIIWHLPEARNTPKSR